MKSFSSALACSAIVLGACSSASRSTEAAATPADVSAPAPAIPNELPIEGSISGWVWKNQLPYVTADIQQEARFAAIRHARDYPVKSVCILPLTTARRRLGVLNFWSDKAGAYDQLDLEFAQLVTAQIAVAVENAFNFEKAETLRFLWDGTGRTIGQAAIAGILANSAFTTVLPTCVTVDEVREYAAASELPLTPEEKAALDDLWSRNFDHEDRYEMPLKSSA